MIFALDNHFFYYVTSGARWILRFLVMEVTQSEHRSGFSVQIPSDVVVGIVYATDTKTEHLVSRRGKV